MDDRLAALMQARVSRARLSGLQRPRSGTPGPAPRSRPTLPLKTLLMDKGPETTRWRSGMRKRERVKHRPLPPAISAKPENVP